MAETCIVLSVVPETVVPLKYWPFLINRRNISPINLNSPTHDISLLLHKSDEPESHRDRKNRKK